MPVKSSNTPLAFPVIKNPVNLCLKILAISSISFDVDCPVGEYKVIPLVYSSVIKG